MSPSRTPDPDPDLVMYITRVDADMEYVIRIRRPHLTVKYRVTAMMGGEGSVRAAGEQEKVTKWIDPPLQIREREIGPIRTEVTERVLIFQRPKRTRNVLKFD